MLFKAAFLCKCLLKFLPISAKNVYKYLWKYYNENTSKLFGQFVKEKIRIYRYESSIQFILTCKNEDLIPIFARFRLANPYIADAKLRQKCARPIMQAEMKFKQRLLRQTKRYLRRLNAELKQSLPHIVYIRLQTISQEILKKKMHQIEGTHEKKLNSLREKKTTTCYIAIYP